MMEEILIMRIFYGRIQNRLLETYTHWSTNILLHEEKYKNI